MACMRCGREAAAGAPRCADCPPAAALPPGRGQPRGSVIVLLTAGLVVAAAGTGAGVLLTRPQAATGHPAAGQSADAARRPAAASAGRMEQAAADGPRAGVVIMARARAQPAAAAVGAFLARYFAVINRHDYAGYLRLFGPGSRRSLSAARFRAGYGSTRDSAETLTRISAARPGVVAATVTFTSTQAPAASPAHAACVRWRITVFLLRQEQGYAISPPPPGYAAAERAC
jgi:hypothetical protein